MATSDIVYIMDIIWEGTSPTEQLLRGFDSHLRRRGRAASTRRQYGFALDRFATWLGARSPSDLRPAQIELFLTEWEAGFQLRHGHYPTPATMRGAIGALRVFYAYLEQADLLIGHDGQHARNPMRTIEVPTAPQRPNDFLRPHEDRALSAADCPHHHRIIVSLLRYTGVRVAEARAFTLADVDLTTNSEALTVRVSKTAAGTRTIPILPQLIPLLHEHITDLRRHQATSDQTPLLATRHGTPVTTHYMWRVVKRVAADAGIRPIPCNCNTKRQDQHANGCPRTTSGDNRSRTTPHTLRRTFGSDLINRGLRLETVSKLLGHSNTTVTERAYAQLLAPTIRQELLNVFNHNPNPTPARNPNADFNFSHDATD